MSRMSRVCAQASVSEATVILAVITPGLKHRGRKAAVMKGKTEPRPVLKITTWRMGITELAGRRERPL